MRWCWPPGVRTRRCFAPALYHTLVLALDLFVLGGGLFCPGDNYPQDGVPQVAVLHRKEPDDELLFRLALLAKLAMVDMKVAAEAILTDVLTGA
jgi:hypothetical protein